MNKTVIALALMLGVAGLAGTTYAYDRGNQNVDHEAMMTAIEAGDYETFVSLLPEAAQANMTEEQFAKIQERHENMTQAREEEGEMGMRRGGMRGGQPENHEEVQAAVEAGDYETFVSLLPEQAQTDMTEEKFAKLQEMQAAMESGDYETAKELREELGIGEKGPKGAMGEGMMMGRGKESEEMLAAIEAGDYDTFVSLLPEEAQADMTEERFAEIVANHETRADMEANHEAAEAAIEANDYEAFLATLSEDAQAEMTEEKFAEMVERHEIMEALREAVEAGDDEAIEALQDELGMMGPGMGIGAGEGMGQGRGQGMGMKQGGGNHAIEVEEI